MRGNEFMNYWNKKHPESLPVCHELKSVYHDKWFRVHSLPKSKRYPETVLEWETLLNRQNQLIEDLIGTGTEVIILFPYFSEKVISNIPKTISNFGVLHKATAFHLHEVRSETYKTEMYLYIFTRVVKWQKDHQNNLLKAIAEDQIRAMFICPSKESIIAPYDGGVDIITHSKEQKNICKLKYADWLSARKDNL